MKLEVFLAKSSGGFLLNLGKRCRPFHFVHKALKYFVSPCLHPHFLSCRPTPSSSFTLECCLVFTLYILRFAELDLSLCPVFTLLLET